EGADARAVALETLENDGSGLGAADLGEAHPRGPRRELGSRLRRVLELLQELLVFRARRNALVAQRAHPVDGVVLRRLLRPFVGVVEHLAIDGAEAGLEEGVGLRAD